jgi:hypothetical protein
MRNPSRFILASLLALSTSVLATSVLAAPILTNAELQAGAWDASLLGLDTQTSLLAVGGSAAASASMGAASADIQGAAIATGNGFTLDFSFTDRVGAPHPDLTYTVDLQADAMLSGTFTLDADDVGFTYAMEADFDQAGTSMMVLHTYLYDLIEPGPSLFSVFQHDPISTDGSMGTEAGKHAIVDSRIGWTSGDLIAGHSYGYAMNALIGHDEAAYGETAAEAHGTFKLAIQGPAPEAVPEPSSLALFGLGLGGMLLAFRKRSAQRS